MLRLHRKRQKMLARLKKISKESHETSLDNEKGLGILQKGVRYPKEENLMDSGNTQETRNYNSKLLYALRTINLVSRDVKKYFEEKDNEDNTEIVDLKAFEEDTNNPLPITQTCRTSSYSLKNLPFFRQTFLPNNFVFAISLVFPKQTRFYLV